jgi:hypothetical protein
MDQAEFLTIFASYENLDAVKQTLPSVIEETKRNNAKLIVHDSSTPGREDKWNYLLDLNKDKDFFLILSDNMSMAHARNMCLHLGRELYAPAFICLVEDDHGFRPGLIPAMIEAMNTYYGSVSPNGLRYGLFTGCGAHNIKRRALLSDGNAYPKADLDPELMGRANSCFRCAPASHWADVLKGYDTDEYLISKFQTNNLNLRNYHKGFTAMIVKDGALVFEAINEGRGYSAPPSTRLWDDQYAASDARSRYAGKTKPEAK